MMWVSTSRSGLTQALTDFGPGREVLVRTHRAWRARRAAASPSPRPAAAEPGVARTEVGDPGSCGGGVSAAGSGKARGYRGSTDHDNGGIVAHTAHGDGARNGRWRRRAAHSPHPRDHRALSPRAGRRADVHLGVGTAVGGRPGGRPPPPPAPAPPPPAPPRPP